MKIRKVFRYIAGAGCALFVIGLVSLFGLGSPSTFTLVNLSGEAVTVTAKWRNESLELGELNPDEAYSFEVNAEASMVFVVEYLSGKMTETESYYFSTNIDTLTTIYKHEITSRYVSKV